MPAVFIDELDTELVAQAVKQLHELARDDEDGFHVEEVSIRRQPQTYDPQGWVVTARGYEFGSAILSTFHYAVYISRDGQLVADGI